MSEQPLNPTPAGSHDADATADATAEETTAADEAAALR
ncbi:tRNA (guanosine(46)-N7)-methyltransferase TrmB, partial [Streptomyces parvus]|nr:tRNA (guanosine(46)-N7)-methyltransferase TrmB [Streptomyces parvus]